MRYTGNVATVISMLMPVVASAQSTIDPMHKFGWGENIGWTNWRDANGGDDGVVVGSTFLSGFIWGENVGWIHLNSSSTGGATARPEVEAPTASQIAAGLVGNTPIPWASDRQPDGDVDAADVVTRVNDGFP